MARKKTDAEKNREAYRRRVAANNKKLAKLHPDNPCLSPTEHPDPDDDDDDGRRWDDDGDDDDEDDED